MTKKSKDVRLKQLLRLGICGALIALIAMVGVVMASAEEPVYSEGLKFTSNGDGTCYVSGMGTCTDTELVIPPVSPAGDTVTAIRWGAFYNCVSLKTVMVPASVTHIHYEAFKGCTGLTSVQFAGTSQLTSIESEAFMGCKNLEDFTIPASVNNIMSGTLDECPKLIDFEDGVGYVDQWAVTSDSDITQLILREDTVGIAWGAFANCENLFSVSFPESVKYINECAFGGCSSLTDVVIPAGVVTLQQAVFNQCYSLTRAWILTNDPSAFQPGVFGNSGLHYAYLVGTEEDWKDVVKSAFYTGDRYGDVTIYYNITFDVNGIVYTSNGDGTCYVCDIGSCTDTEVVIPSVSPAGDTVTGIGDGAFMFAGFTTIQLPETLNAIGEWAFFECHYLTTINIPANVTTIKKNAFSDCSGLKAITIPSSVTSIGYCAFSYCNSMETIIVEGENSVYHSVNNCLIHTASKTLIAGSSNSKIPYDGSVTTIGPCAFSLREGLTSINIPKSVTYFDQDPFSLCTVSDVYYEGAMTDWENIYGISNYFPSDTTIHYNTTLDENGILYTSNGDGTCYVSGRGPGYPSQIDVLVIPSVSPAGDTVTAIGDAVFKDATFTSIQLPETLEAIGNDAFCFNYKLKSIEIPANVTYIGNHAFGSCDYLETVTFPMNSKLTHIGNNAFVCLSITSIKLPETLETIGQSAFSWNLNLQSIEIPKNITSIEDQTFMGCYNLKTVIFSTNSKLTYIGKYAFDVCYALESICIPEGVTCIDASAFNFCRSLTNIIIPSSMTSIGVDAFKDCSNLTDVYFLGTQTEWSVITIDSNNEYLLNATIHYLGDLFDLTSASLTLGDSLTMNYYAKADPAYGTPAMRFTYRGETETVLGVPTETEGEYVFSLTGIAPQCMGETIKAELILTLEDGTELVVDAKASYSVREYCDDALAANPNNKTLATLLADLLAYGDAAQDYANYNEETPAGDGFEVAPSQWEAVTDTDLTLSDKTSDTVYFAAAGVRFDYINRVYFKIKAADLTGVTLTVNGMTYTADDLILMENTADTYILYTDAVYATEFDKVFTAKLALNGEELQTVTYSVRSYVYTKQNSNDTELAALVRALYNYGRSAIAYKNAQ